MRRALRPIFILTILVLTTRSFGQNETPSLPIDTETNKIMYTEVIRVDSSVTKDILYSKAREWFAIAFKSSNDVVQLEDKENGKIIGKAIMNVYYKSMGREYPSKIRYSIAIQVKDGRYKYEITDFIHETDGVCEEMINTKKKVMGVSLQKNYNFYLNQLDSYSKSLASDIKATMNKTTKKKDEW